MYLTHDKPSGLTSFYIVCHFKMYKSECIYDCTSPTIGLYGRPDLFYLVYVCNDCFNQEWILKYSSTSKRKMVKPDSPRRFTTSPIYADQYMTDDSFCD